MLTLERMRALVRKGLGNATVDDLPNDEVDELLNISLWEISDRFPFKTKEYEEEIETIAFIDSYDVPVELDALYSIAVLGIGDEEGEPLKLTRKSRDWFDVNRKIPVDGEDPESSWTGKPRNYVRWGDQIILHPIPDEVYRLRIQMWTTVATLTESDEGSGLPRNWDEIVVQGAITRGHYYNEDYNLARQAENFRVGNERKAINTTTKEERDARYAKLNVIWEFPEDPEEDGG